MTNAGPVSPGGGGEILKTLRIKPIETRPRHFLDELSLSQLQKLVDQFDLGRIVRMDEPLNTQCNITEPFHTGQGAFMIRIRHGEEFGERVEFIHSMMGHLRSCGLPVPEVMRTPKGSSWTLWGDRIVEIHRYIRHDAGMHRDWQRMFSTASALGDLHASFHTYSCETPPVPPEMRNDLSPADCWNMVPQAERNVLRSEGPEEDVRSVLDHLARARDALAPMLDDYERFLGSLPWMFVHGDFHLWNLLYRGDDIVGLVDFDFLQERERIFDLAYCMQSIIGYMHYVEGRTSGDYDKLSWRNLRMWIDQYDSASHSPLSEEERRSLPRELLRIYLVNMVVSAAQENPLPMMPQAIADLDLYLWIGANEGIFL